MLDGEFVADGVADALLSEHAIYRALGRGGLSRVQRHSTRAAENSYSYPDFRRFRPLRSIVTELGHA